MKFIGVLFLAAFASLIGSALTLPVAVAKPEKKSEAVIRERQEYQEDVVPGFQ
jgi:hypothetical protein